ncbi:CHAD domain-containing protein [Streptomyces sp. NPDC014734]|uniref:CYTH and CHAD domain-containing protein n=1 Tax=Streptomyces sp. NPDC014734 TaxID=3364886 RepID=UPI0036FC61CC
MADSTREIARTYEVMGVARLPDLTRVAGVASVAHRGVDELDALHYDTEDLRLTADSLSLRRCPDGHDAGWHLTIPIAPNLRDDLREPLSDTVPHSFAGLLRSRIRDNALVPVARLLGTRDAHHLNDADGTLLAAVSVDTVRAERPAGGPAAACWTTIEVRLADGGDPALLDLVEQRLRRAGAHPVTAPSALARALAATDPDRAPASARGRSTPETAAPATAGDHVLAYLRAQTEEIVALDPAVRRDLLDSVHRMRVATRRLRSALRTYRKILDRNVTDPVGDELRWLAAELGVGRDQEVLDARLRADLDELPGTLTLGPVRARLRIWSTARGGDSRARVLAVLDGPRYLTLLNRLDALLAGPPLLPAASRAPGRTLSRAVLKDYARLAARVDRARDLPPGHARDLALHDARKAAKRARYAAEAARPALGKPADRFAGRMKALQTLLGDHQDSVVARDALRDLAVRAHAAGEPSFTWGLLHGREEAVAAARERRLPRAWRRASRPGLRRALDG